MGTGGACSLISMRRLASRLAFGLASLLAGGASLILLSAWSLPYEGLQDLGRVVMAMLLAAISAPLFAYSLIAGHTTGMPRWMLVTSAMGALVGLVPLVALVAARLAV